MRLERRLRDGQEDGSVIGRQVGTFERHTKVSTGPSPFTPFPSPLPFLPFFPLPPSPPLRAPPLESSPFPLQGIGRKVMERQGWAEGRGLGSQCSGVPEALDNDGQHPRCKRGLG